jgi:hypothetical protein
MEARKLLYNEIKTSWVNRLQPMHMIIRLKINVDNYRDLIVLYSSP